MAGGFVPPEQAVRARSRAPRRRRGRRGRWRGVDQARGGAGGARGRARAGRAGGRGARAAPTGRPPLGRHGQGGGRRGSARGRSSSHQRRDGGTRPGDAADRGPPLGRDRADAHAGLTVAPCSATPRTRTSWRRCTSSLAARAAEARSGGHPARPHPARPRYRLRQGRGRATCACSRRCPTSPRSATALVVGASRKSFIGALAGGGVEERLAGSLAAIADTVGLPGVLVRVHDVAATVQFLTVLSALRGAA